MDLAVTATIASVAVATLALLLIFVRTRSTSGEQGSPLRDRVQDPVFILSALIVIALGVGVLISRT